MRYWVVNDEILGQKVGRVKYRHCGGARMTPSKMFGEHSLQFLLQQSPISPSAYRAGDGRCFPILCGASSHIGSTVDLGWKSFPAAIAASRGSRGTTNHDDMRDAASAPQSWSASKSTGRWSSALGTLAAFGVSMPIDQSFDDLCFELCYRSYRTNRLLFPTIEAGRWSLIYGDAAQQMEACFQRERAVSA